MAKTWLVWKSKGSSIIPRYEIEDNDPDNWKQGEEHDLNIRRLYPASFDGQFVLQLECEGGDLDKDEIIDNGSENWKGDFIVTPTAPNVKIEVKSDDTEIELEEEFIQEDIINWNRTIIYKTSDNQPLTNLAGNTSDFISNIYDEENDYCILTLKEDLINLIYPIFSSHNTLTDIIYLPSCLEKMATGGFCIYCSSLENINLSNLVNLKNISGGFCQHCISLKNLDLSKLINLETIGGGFCTGCSQLENINLSNLIKLKETEGAFCNKCISLKNIDLSSLINLEKIGDWFLYESTSIESIDLSPLINLKEIVITEDTTYMEPSGFASSSLKELKTINYFETFNKNLRYLNDLIILSEEFQNNLVHDSTINDHLKIWVHDDLYNQYIETYPKLAINFWCIEDEEQHLPQKPNSEIWYKTSDNQPVNLKITDDFGANFISNTYDSQDDCCKIKFNGDVTVIPGNNNSDSFMSKQNNLIEIIHLPSTIKSIGNYFLSSCSGLQSINLSGLKNVTSIGSNFLINCTGLQSIDLSPLNSISNVDNTFLYGCSSLQSINLSGLKNATSIGNSFLYMCLKLTQLDLSPLSNITSIKDRFLYWCSGLTQLDLSGLKNVISIGNDFLINCSQLKIFIINVPEKIVSLPLTTPNLSITPDKIYVNDELLEEYKEAVPKFADKFKPLSEYTE